MKLILLAVVVLGLAAAGCQKEIKEIRGHSDSPALADGR